MRLSKIVTKTGDDGTTGIAGGERVLKSHPRIQAMGDVDELNSQIGLILTLDGIEYDNKMVLQNIQHRLFDVGGEISVPCLEIIDESDVSVLDDLIVGLNENMSILRDFILPGGTEKSAQMHIARTICRRAERSLVLLSESEVINPEGLKYLNRLSDYLFVLARWYVGNDIVIWMPKKKPPKTDCI